MIRSILFLIPSPLTRRDYERFGIEILQENGFEVEIWDLTAFLYPSVARQIFAKKAIPKVRSLQSRAETILALKAKNPKETFIVNLLPFNSRSLGIYRAIASIKCAYGLPLWGTIPTPASLANEDDSIKERGSRLLKRLLRLRSLNCESIISWIMWRVPLELLGITPAACVFLDGERSLPTYERSYPISAGTRRIWCHALDYDVALRIASLPIETRGPKTAVFLDDYLPFHSDYGYLGTTCPVPADRYYATLVAFFEHLETRFGYKVIVAAHPRSEYEKHPDLFRRRLVVRGRTAELVRASDLVLTQHSTAINFAVLYKKPLIFLTMSELEGTDDGAFNTAFAAYFNQTPLNISRHYELQEQRLISYDPDSYARYAQDFIKKAGSPDHPFWQIVADAIKALPA